jgi:nucleotide-binding universal stress UspA family protein
LPLWRFVLSLGKLRDVVAGIVERDKLPAALQRDRIAEGPFLRVSDAIAVQGPVLASILEMSHKLSADMLIMGSHQHGALYRLVHGDTTAEAVTQAPCPVLVVPS